MNRPTRTVSRRSHAGVADAYGPEVEFMALGPVEVYEGGHRLALGGPKQRSVLALLMAGAGRPVPMGTLIEGAYGEAAPERVHRSIHTFISNLRSELGEVIERHGDGYALTADRSRLDTLRFEDLVAAAGRERDPASARDVLRDALELWRGHPFADVDGHGLLAPEITRLNELRVAAIEARVDADMASGRDRELLAELESLTSEYPLHERFRAQQMLALYRAGRQGDALRAFERTRSYLVDELGLDPSPELRQLEQRILEQDSSLVIDVRPKVRRVVILVADIAEPDALLRLDPGQRHQLLSFQSAAIDHAVASNIGRVVAQRGSAVYASFDDAVAAARAAADVQASTAGASPRMRIAIAAGEVEVVGGDEMAGPPISRAAALAAVAHGGQVLVSADAHAAMVRSGTPGLVMASLGSHDIEGLAKGELVYQLRLDGDQEFPPLRVDELPPPLPIPERGLPGYELREEVGSGAFGVVHRAYQPTAGQEVAIKAIRAEYANRPDFIRRFEVDAQLVARLQHPHIVPLLDHWREPDGAFLVTRWMRGGTLADRVEHGPLAIEKVDVLVRTVGSALDHAHRHGVVHRDVRPSNVLFDEDGNAYLADFVVAGLEGDERGAVASDIRDLARLADRCLDETGPVDRVLARATTNGGYPSVEALLDAWQEAMGSGAEGAVYTSTRNPYKGLNAFGELDAEDFFGREAETARVLAAVDERNLVAVVGPSGVGKSSVVKAGLIPALRREGLPGSAEWLVTDMRPGPDPFASLATALSRVASRPTLPLEQELRGPELGLGRVLERYLPDSAELLLVIDQFEELFTLVHDDDERSAFLDLLQTAVTTDHSRVRIVVTIRADFFDRPLRFGAFGELLRDATVPIASPTAAALRAMVVEPAERMGVAVPSGLADRVVADVEDQPGGLPLVEFTMTELFERRISDRLDLDAYQAAGGVLGALGRRAEETYAGLSGGEQEAARQVFLRLVNVADSGRPTRRRVRRSELERLGLGPGVAAVIAAFGDSRLLTFDRDPITRGPTVEVAHEALISEWGRYASWVEEHREDLVLRLRLAGAVADWEGSDRDDAYLLSGGRLDHDEAWAGEAGVSLTTTERAFLEQSRRLDDARRARRGRNRRLLMAGFAVVAVVAVILALRAEQERSEAARQSQIARENEARAEAEAAEAERQSMIASENEVRADVQAAEAQRQSMIARANELAAISGTQIAEDPERAVMLALEGIDLGTKASMEQADLALLGNALREAMLADRVVARRAGALFADVHPSGEIFLTGDGSDAVIRTIEGGEEQARFAGPGGSEAQWGGFIGDGSRIGVVFVFDDDAATWKFWDVSDTDRPVHEVAHDRATTSWMHWGGDRIVEKVCDPSDGCHTRILDARTLLEVDDFASTYGDIAVDRSGRWLADADDEAKTVHIHDLDSGRNHTVSVPAVPDWMAFSPGAEDLAFVNTLESGVWVVEVSSGEVVVEERVDRPYAVAWTEDGSELVITGNAAIPEVIDAETGRLRLRLQGQQGVLQDAASMIPGTDLMVTAGSAVGEVVIWDIGTAAPGALRTIETGLEAVRILSYLPNGDIIVAGQGPGPATIFDENGMPRDRIEGVQEHFGEMTSDVYGGGRYLAWVDVGGAGVVADLETGDIVYRAPAGYQVADLTPDLSHLLLATYAPGSPPGDPYLVEFDSGRKIARFPVDHFCLARLSLDARLIQFWECDVTGRFFDRTGAELPNARYSGTGAIFLPDGNTVVTAGLSGEVRLTDIDRLVAGDTFAEATSEIDAHDAFLTDLDTDAAGTLVVSAARLEPTRVWDAATKVQIAEVPYALLPASSASPAAALHPTRRRVLVAAAGGVLLEYTWDLGEMVEQAAASLSRSMTVSECETHLRDVDCAAYLSSPQP